MKFIKYHTLLAVVSTSLVIGSGCSNMTDSEQTEAQGAGIGALLGAVIGKKMCSDSNDILCMAIGGAVGAVAGGAYGREIAKQKEKYVKLEDFYGNTIHEVTNDNIQLVRQNKNLRQNIFRIKKSIQIAKASSLSASKKKAQLVAIKKNLDNKVNKNKESIKKYNGNLAYANAVLKDLQKEIATKKKKALAASKASSGSKKVIIVKRDQEASIKVIASQHTKLKREITQLKSNIKKLENQNEQLAELDPSLI